MTRTALFLAALACPAACPLAAPLTVAMARPGSALEIRMYALGIVPIDGEILDFSGRFAVDPDAAGQCRVELSAKVASLRLADEAMQRDALSAELLDAAQYPGLSYSGACAGGAIEGSLTLHGQTHPLRLSLERDGRRYVAEGSLRRAEWGVVGRPNTAGSTVRIRVTTELPQ